MSPQYLIAVIALASIGGFIFKFGSSTSAVESKKKVCSGKAILLDVRTASEFSQRHIKGAINIPVQDVANQISRIKSELALKGATSVEIYCRSGARAGQAERILKSQGLNAHSFGSIQSWPSAPEAGCDASST